MRRAILSTILFIVALLAIRLVANQIFPLPISGTLKVDGATENVLLPFRRVAAAGQLDFSLTLTLPTYAASLYAISSYDCVETMTVNGVAIEPFCAPEGKKVDLSRIMRPGSNTVVVRLREAANYFPLHFFHMRAAASDARVRFVHALLAAAIGLYALFGIGPLLRRRIGWVGLGIFACGVLVRTFYVLGTAFIDRAYDVLGHLDYIWYVKEHLSLPGPQWGWESYQPPLYYILGAVVLRVSEFVDHSTRFMFQDLQVAALLCSVAVLGIGFQIGRLVFPRKDEGMEQWLFWGIVAAFPALVNFASRISNDVLLQVWLFISLLFLLRFWSTGKGKDFYWSCAALGLAILTKTNAVLLIPPLFGSLLLHPKLALRAKFRIGAMGAGIVVAITGWFFALRFLVQGETSIVGNAYRLHPYLRLEWHEWDLFTFNPLRVLRQPYISINAAFPKNFFWEYYLRSALLGGYPHLPSMLPHATMLLMSAMALIPWTLRGIWREARRGFGIPLCLTLVTFLFGHVLFRIAFPFASSQHFRYSLLVIVPIAYFTARGVRGLSSSLQILALSCVLAFIALAALFPLALYITA